MATDANANFVVVWDSRTYYGQPRPIFGRRFDSSGSPVGPEFQVSAYTTERDGAPAIAMRPSGEFVVVWYKVAAGETFQCCGREAFGRVFARLFDAAGNPLGPQFEVAAGTTNDQREPDVAMDDSGGFVVVWQRQSADGRSDIHARRFDASGSPLGGDFLVNAYTTDHDRRARIAADGAGNFVVVWDRLNPGGGSFARRFDASGTPQGPDVPVANVGAPRVAMGGQGRFMVVWPGPSDGNYWANIRGRIFDSAVTPVGPEIEVNTRFPIVPPDLRVVAYQPTVAADEAGTFVVAWGRHSYRFYDSHHHYGNYEFHVRTRRFDASGNPLAQESVTNTLWHPREPRGNPSVASRKAGEFIVAWERRDASSRSLEVFARSPDVIFTDGFETRDLSSWSFAANDGGDVSVSSAAAMAAARPWPAMWPSHGLQVAVDDRTGVFVQDESPAAEARYRARFYLDPNGFDPGESAGQFRQRVLLALSGAPLKRLLVVVLRRMGGQYAVAAHVRRDDDTLARTAFSGVSDGPHAIEFDWQKATAPGASDGRFELWIDGTSVATLTGLDNDERAVDLVRMGAVGVKDGASGTLYFDEFVSRRIAYSGP